jgi:hypothetical protein
MCLPGRYISWSFISINVFKSCLILFQWGLIHWCCAAENISHETTKTTVGIYHQIKYPWPLATDWSLLGTNNPGFWICGHIYLVEHPKMSWILEGQKFKIGCCCCWRGIHVFIFYLTYLLVSVTTAVSNVSIKNNWKKSRFASMLLLPAV